MNEMTNMESRRLHGDDDVPFKCLKCGFDARRRTNFSKKSPHNDDALVGRFFHTFDDGGGLGWQGYVTERVKRGLYGPETHYLVQLLSLLDGTPSAVELVSLKEMRRWKFYGYGPDGAMEMADAVAKRSGSGGE